MLTHQRELLVDVSSLVVNRDKQSGVVETRRSTYWFATLSERRFTMLVACDHHTHHVDFLLFRERLPHFLMSG